MLTLAEVETLARAGARGPDRQGGPPLRRAPPRPSRKAYGPAAATRTRSRRPGCTTPSRMTRSPGVAGRGRTAAVGTKDIVLAVTKRGGEPPRSTPRRILATPGALLVKEADLAHNADPARLAVLDEPTRTRLTEKYATHARTSRSGR